MKPQQGISLSVNEYGLSHNKESSSINEKQQKKGKKVNIQTLLKQSNEVSKNQSMIHSAKKALYQTINEDELQLFLEADDVSKSDVQNDSIESKSPLNINTSGRKFDLMMDLISHQTHYKIGINEELDNIMKKGKINSFKVVTEQEQDLDGWLKKQQALKISNTIFSYEEESKKEMNHKLLDEVQAQDTPELNQKVISAIMRDRPVLKLRGKDVASELQSPTIMSKGSLFKPSLKKLLMVKNQNKDYCNDDDQNMIQQDGHLHVTAATSANLLRIYNPYMKIENQEEKKRLKTEIIISNLILQKVQQEENKLKKINQNQSDLSQSSNRSKILQNYQYQKQNKVLTAAEIQEEENQRVQKLIDIGKQKAKNTLKNFKGLQNFYLDNILQNDNIKRKLEENQKSHKPNFFNFKGENLNAPFSEIENIYIPKYLSTSEKLNISRIQQYELRIEIANKVDLINDKLKEITELQNQLENVSPQNRNQNAASNSRIKSSPFISFKAQNKVSSRNIQNSQEEQKINKSKELTKEQTNLISNHVDQLKKELHFLENRMVSFQENIKQLKNLRTKIRAYVKESIIGMMHKDLILFVDAKKPIDLSLPIIVATLIKIGENVYNENFPQYLDQSQKDVIIQIASLLVDLERIKDKDLKEINQIKLPSNTQQIFSQISYQCSKQSISQEAGKRIKELTKDTLSVKKPIFKLDEDSNTHTMQYENVIQSISMPKKMIIAKQQIEEKKDAVLNRLSKREIITKYLSSLQEKIKQLEEKELERLQKIYSNLNNDHIAYLKSVLISIFGVIRGSEQFQFFLSSHQFKKQLLYGNNFTTKEKIDLINSSREKSTSSFSNQDQDNTLERTQKQQKQQDDNLNLDKWQNKKKNRIEEEEEDYHLDKPRERSCSIQRKQDLQFYQEKNKGILHRINTANQGMATNQLFNTFMKSINSQQSQNQKSKLQIQNGNRDYCSNSLHDYSINSPKVVSKVYSKDIILSQSSQQPLLSERGLLFNDSQSSYYDKDSSPQSKIQIEISKMNKLVQFKKQTSIQCVTPSHFSRNILFYSSQKDEVQY